MSTSRILRRYPLANSVSTVFRRSASRSGVLDTLGHGCNRVDLLSTNSDCVFRQMRLLTAAAVGPGDGHTPPVDYFTVKSDPALECGDFDIIASQQEVSRSYATVESLNASQVGQNVWIRGRINAKRIKGNACFLTIRSSLHTVQICFFNTKDQKEASRAMINYLDQLTLESVVDVYGTVVAANVKSCTQRDVELQIKKVFAVSRAPVVLPFLMEDAARPQHEIDASKDSERPFSNVPQDMRLDNRWLDLRVPSNNAIMRIKSGVCALFRESLASKGFTEIITPKLISGVSEGGANVFKTNYFDQVACLAQSPQLYKQMAISADLERVFEIGPVFRAENSHTKFVTINLLFNAV
jgi:aspartyl/asparaginyl-tRNA synthetase